MSRDIRHRQFGRLVCGAFVVAVGVFALLDNLHLFDSRVVLPYWPLVFVALGALRLAQPRRPGGVLVGAALVLIGGALTLQNLGLLQFRVRDLWPLLVIGAGLSVVAKALRPGGDGGGHGAGPRGHVDEIQEHGERLDASATLSGLVLRNDSPDFRGGDIGAVMGGVEIDLRQADIASRAVLHLSVVMGGVEIRVPREWSVAVACTPILGGVEDKTQPPVVPGKLLVLQGTVIMGGVEIGN